MVCDGHEFHETMNIKHKEIAFAIASYRSGYKVFRFTGSEVFKDPFAWAKKSFDAAFQK